MAESRLWICCWSCWICCCCAAIASFSSFSSEEVVPLPDVWLLALALPPVAASPELWACNQPVIHRQNTTSIRSRGDRRVCRIVASINRAVRFADAKVRGSRKVQPSTSALSIGLGGELYDFGRGYRADFTHRPV